MESTPSFRISFVNTTPAQANVHAADLAAFLRDAAPREDFQIERQRTNEQAQDFGTTLVLILGTAAATAIGKGLQSWLARTGVVVEITDETGRLVATNVDSKNAASIVKSWAARPRTGSR